MWSNVVHLLGVSEFAVTEPSVLLFSADDMSKKGILRNSVSHKTVPTGFTLLEDAPMCLDHDFPVSDRMLLCTSGYFLINEGKGEQVNDSNGRPQFAKPEGTALHLCNRAFRYQGPNADRHVQDFLEFWHATTPNLQPVSRAVIIVDNGPDYNIGRPLIEKPLGSSLGGSWYGLPITCKQCARLVFIKSY